MNQALFPASGSFATRSSLPIAPAWSARNGAMALQAAWDSHEEAVRLRRLRSLLGLFCLYAAALLIVVTVSEGADIGCILGGIAGHVLYATHRIVFAWRDATWLEDAKHRATPILRRRMLVR